MPGDGEQTDRHTDRQGSGCSSPACQELPPPAEGWRLMGLRTSHAESSARAKFHEEKKRKSTDFALAKWIPANSPFLPNLCLAAKSYSFHPTIRTLCALEEIELDCQTTAASRTTFQKQDMFYRPT